MQLTLVVRTVPSRPVTEICVRAAGRRRRAGEEGKELRVGGVGDIDDRDVVGATEPRWNSAFCLHDTFGIEVGDPPLWMGDHAVDSELHSKWGTERQLADHLRTADLADVEHDKPSRAVGQVDKFADWDGRAVQRDTRFGGLLTAGGVLARDPPSAGLDGVGGV